MGQYYQVEAEGLIRQYTVCKVIKPDIYNRVCKLETPGGQEAVEDNTNPSFSAVNPTTLRVTPKNYDTGMSKLLHGTESVNFKIKGPMGPGLLHHSEGLHVAFAAGTGILPFLDLVAIILSPERTLIKPDFKFQLHVSFQSEEDAIGLELLRLTAEQNPN